VKWRKRYNMVLRAFTFDLPLPEGFAERMRQFDSGENTEEEMWREPYRMDENEEEPLVEMPRKFLRRKRDG